MSADGPFCPECAEPVGADTEYCMHCYQDFSGDVSPVDTMPDGVASADATDSGAGYDEWQTGTQGAGEGAAGSTDSFDGYEQWQQGDTEVLDPEGFVDNALTVIVGIVAGLIIGTSAMIMLGFLAGGWGFLLGFFVWLGTTAHLVRRYTVQEAIAHGGYALAAVLMAAPLVAAVVGGPALDDRLSAFFAALMFASIPAVIAGSVGWVASRFVPEQGSEA